MDEKKIVVLAAGGTVDKVYYDALGDYRVGEPQASRILQQAGIGLDCRVESLVRKDSLDMGDADREKIRERVATGDERCFVITHGTDTMVDSAVAVGAPPGKTVLFTGAMSPARFRDTDADFNLGFAMAAVQLLPPGVYIAMNAEVFKPGEVVKNRAAGRFESTGV